ncbi:pentatricopeptide repeat-containing protein At4g13650-like isoform X1 [Selaginella moellendorffii]|uniref:pentatricopeptide repeat-containing protein At4g13650-like isoform X1 n=2 Tax=Selaginella moellendorffii TaxID=88036 RepID=UPI000D1C7D93|nr:pentatricopeptide repeat-containing protein At4g13650-like isoform X1 [Selaginella moellendorffii]|eukprot:XP_024543425.1 pentatricopeptide repeat-containing protein At4g13650-like isoform X1 [Selaginella moellendorffii]
MILEGMQLSLPTFCSALQACSLKRDSRLSKTIRELIDWSGIDKMDSIRADLVSAYSKCGDMEEARKIFDRMESRDVLTWTVMIKGYAQQGDSKAALELFHRMKPEGVEPDSVSVAEAIMACSIEGDLEQGNFLAMKQDFRFQPIGNALLSLHIKCGSVKEALEVFDRTEEKDVVTWTLMLECYSQQQQRCGDYSTEAFGLYHKMLLEGKEPSYTTYAAVVSACSPQTFRQGKAVHRRIIECQLERLPDIAVALVNMYCKCGSEQEIREVFAKTRQQNKVVMWNAVIAAFNRHDSGEEAIRVYREMVLEGLSPSVVTFMSVLSSCARVEDLRTGREVHSRALACGMLPDFVKNALITMYARCNALGEARQVFESVGEKCTVTWTALIGGCVSAGNEREALSLFKRMDSEPDEVTFSSVLQACSNLEDGREVHARILAAQGGKMSDFLGNGLINMYARCGSMRDARQIFESMDRSSRISWSAIMTLCARHGQHDDIIDTYRLMVNEGVVPDGVTLIAILNSCSHAGLTDEACHYFTWIISDFELPHLDEHYQCMVDLLCRAGRLDEAEELISMIDRPDVVTLNTMLAACKNQQDLHRGARTAAQMQSTESCAAPFVLLSQIYAGEHHNTPVPG